MVMKYGVLGCILLTVRVLPAADKLTDQDRLEIIRGLMAEYATARVTLPRSKKPLEFESKGTYDKASWAEAARNMGPAARVGDMVQITRVTIENEKILLEINYGLRGRGSWKDHVQVGMGGMMQPIGQGTAAPGGTSIAVVFDQRIPLVKSSEIKKMLAPILDFDKHSATEHYAETLPEPIKQAIASKRVIVGMDRDQVLLAVGRPVHKSRETKDGVDFEDWVFGQPPGKITFVTFQGAKVVKVKEEYAGLGGSTVDPPTPVP
jgi:hypothetical protein